MKTRPTRLAFALATIALVAAPGPIEEPAPSVSGVVTQQGKPLSGKIVFHLADDEFVGGKVRDGKYKVTRLPVGVCRVSFEAPSLPKKYASEEITPFTVDVKLGSNQFDFDFK